MSIERRNIEPEQFNRSPEQREIPRAGDHKLPEIPMKKSFSRTRLGRVLSGKNRTGRVIHAVLDVLPLPNVHEVAKAVIKDDELREGGLSFAGVLKESVKRLDWIRTAVGLALAVAIIKATDWLGVDLDRLLDLFERISGAL